MMQSIPAAHAGGAARPRDRQPRDPARALRAGFSIIEVTIALFILAFAIATALVTLQTGFKQLDNARYTTLAGQILQSQVEKLRLLNWNQLTNATDGASTHTTFIPDVSADPATQSLITSRFTCSQTIADPPTSSVFFGSVKDITLAVTWTGTDGRRQTLTYLTRYGKDGISDFFVTTH